MKNTTLCYIEQDGCYLLMHRIKKAHDASHNKWIGVGGKCEADEAPDECIVRETKEETGLTLTDYRLRGVVTFLSDEWESEYMFIFTATGFTGRLAENCAEGELAWVAKERIMELPLWQGDKIFLRLLLEDAPFFFLKLRYEGEALVEAVLDGRAL